MSDDRAVSDDHGLFSDPPEPTIAAPPRPHGTASLVVGALALVCALAGVLVLPLLAAVPLAIVGACLGVAARRRATDADDPRSHTRGRATAGLVLSLVALAVSLVWLVLVGEGVRLVLDQCDPDLPDAQFSACMDRHL